MNNERIESSKKHFLFDNNEKRQKLRYFSLHITSVNISLHEKPPMSFYKNSKRIRLVDLSSDKSDELEYIHELFNIHFNSACVPKFMNSVEQILNLSIISCYYRAYLGSIHLQLSNAYCDEEININGGGESSDFSIYPVVPVKTDHTTLYFRRGPRDDNDNYQQQLNYLY